MSVGRVVTVASRVAPKLRARRAAVEMVPYFVLGSFQKSCLRIAVLTETGILFQTPSAVHRLKELLKESPEQKAFRIGVKTRGCNGRNGVV